MGCEARKLHVKDGVTWRSRCYGEVNKYFRLGEYKAQLKPGADILSQDLQPRGRASCQAVATKLGQGVLSQAWEDITWDGYVPSKLSYSH